MKIGIKRRHSSTSVESTSSSMITETGTRIQEKRSKKPPGPGSTKNIKRKASVQDPCTSAEMASFESARALLYAEVMEPDTQNKRRKKPLRRTGSKKNLKKKTSINGPSSSSLVVSVESVTSSVIESMMRPGYQNTGLKKSLRHTGSKKNLKKKTSVMVPSSSSVAVPVESVTSSVIERMMEPDTQNNPRKRSARPGSAENAKKEASVQGPSISGEGQPPSEEAPTEYQCAICLDSTGRKRMKTLPCSHKFHKTCVDRWLLKSRECPVCRTEARPPRSAGPATRHPRDIDFEARIEQLLEIRERFLEIRERLDLVDF